MDLDLKHRPRVFGEVIGQKEVISVLNTALKQKHSRKFLLCGPSGTGKTTVARIAARNAGCSRHNITEVAAARYTGIDDMRELQDAIRFTPLGESKSRAIILDEAHGLSRKAFDSLLKSIEEPPPNVYWFLVTTEPNKIPKTIQTRCVKLNFKSVGNKDLYNFLVYICEREQLKVSEGVLDLVVREAHGSVRQALANLSAVSDLTSKVEAAKRLQAILDTDQVLELCRFLTNKQRGSWRKVMGILGKMEDANPEGVRINVVNYIAVCLRNAKSDDEARAYLPMLDAFLEPYNSSEKLAPLLSSIGRVLYPE